MQPDDKPANNLQSALKPVRQDTIRLFNADVLAVQLEDGRIGATLLSVCQALDLFPRGQTRKIIDDEVLSQELLLVAVETAGGVQHMDVLTAWAIPLWLTGIQTRKLPERKREAILAFKRQAADVLYRHFSQVQQIAPPASLVPAKPIEKPKVPGEGAPRSEWAVYHRAMVEWIEWQADVERWQAETNQRLDGLQSEVESLHEVVRLVPELLERMGPATLTPEHQNSVQALAKRLHEVGGFSFATIYSDLNATFHVGRYEQMPESAWEDVARWFTTRIHSAERRGRS